MRFSRFSVVAALLAAPLLAVAASPATGSFKVSAEVKSACTLTTTDILVASYDPNATTNTTATGTVSVACTKGTAYKTYLKSANSWKLNGPAGEFIPYVIFQGTDSTPWDATSFWSATSAGKAPVDYVATASLTAGKDVSVGTYTDTVNVEVTY
jgi:spore coat protein U-like protein